MSYEIYYDKRFIKVKNGIIPLIQAGSNNCSEQVNGREVPEKNWVLMNYPCNEQVVFSKEELIHLYQGKDYQEYQHKSRQSYHDDFGKWLIAGIKSAMTIDEHRKLGNTLYVKYGHGEEARISSEEEFWEAYNVIRKLNVRNVSLSFTERDINKPPLGYRASVNGKEYPGFYVIKFKEIYLQKVTVSSRYYGDGHFMAKKFITMDAAKAYAAKNDITFNEDNFVEYVEIPCKL